MQRLLTYVGERFSLTPKDETQLKKVFKPLNVGSGVKLLGEGNVEKYLYFLERGVVKGYQNHDGKIVVGNLPKEGTFFSCYESFIRETPTLDNFASVTPCELYRISREDFLLWKNSSKKWADLIDKAISEHMRCNIERTLSFQKFSAKERYINFIEEYAHIAKHVKVETIASFLGMEPQSLSRIRKQVFF